VFPDIDYLAWIEGRPEAATHDLGSSDLRPVTGGSVVPAMLDGLPDQPQTTVETQLAERYDVQPEQVLVTPGASVANLVAAATALGDGGTVLVEKPGYEPMWETPRALGATVERFVRTRDDAWTLDPDRVAAAMHDPVDLVSVTNRHNPTGVVASRDTVADVAATAREHDARLLVDEVYGPYGSDGGERGFGGPTAVGLEGCVVTGSLTKFFGLGGLRIGWLVADEPFVERGRRVLRHLSATAEPSRALARRALANVPELTATACELASNNYDVLRQFVAARSDVSGVVADGTPFALLYHETLDGDVVQAAAAEHDVLVVPGRFFGVSEGFRVSLGRDTETMGQALDALGAALDEHSS
jgi:aspartate/methionine/tyrosine aminotransferase